MKTPRDLFAPFRFACGLSSKNRVVLAPMTNGQSPTTELSDAEFRWLDQRIRGGFGIVTTCATHVLPSAQAWPGELGIFSDRHTPGFARLATAAREFNCLVIPQLFHGGFRCPASVTGQQPVSASEFKLDVPDFEKPRALEVSEIIEIEDAFAAAAGRAIKAGLPGVEIHGANGYLFSQFLSPQTNLRKDEWGGSLANRSRILIDTVKKVRAAIGPAHILGVRLSPEDTKVLTLDIDEMLEVASELSQLGVDYISISLWSAVKLPNKYPDGAETVLAKFRKVISSSVGVTVSGQIWTAADAVAALNEGADFVAMAAAGIANPDWPERLFESLSSSSKAARGVGGPRGNGSFEPHRLPMTPSELQERAVSDSFIEYLKKFKYVLD